MPKALFFNVPAHGHVNPSLPLVKSLVERGHQIRYYVTDNYQERISNTGAEFVAYTHIKSDFFESRGLDGTDPQLAAVTLLIQTRDILPELISIVEAEKPDYILYDCMCPWGYFLAKIVGLPSVSSVSLMPSVTSALLNWEILKLVIPFMIKGFNKGLKATRLSNKIGKQYQVKPLTLVNVLNAPGDISVSYSSPEFIHGGDKLPDYFRFAGWTMPEQPEDPNFVYPSDSKLIYVSLGTVANNNRGFFEACIRALANADYDVLITTGNGISPDSFSNVPDNIRIESWVPQAQILKQASMFITHGGLNSLHDGLYCGLPLLIVPQQTEQTINGLTVINHKAGLMLKLNDVTPQAIQTHVDRLLSEPEFQQNASRIGKSLHREGSMDLIIRDIEGLLH